MILKFESWFDFFIFFIIIIKIIFVISAVGHILLLHIGNPKTGEYDKEFIYWKERTEFIFTICMAILLIYHFNPRFMSRQIDSESKILFFLFGLILIFTAKWNLFVTEAPWYREIVQLFK